MNIHRDDNVIVIYRDEYGLDTKSFGSWDDALNWAEHQPAPYVAIDHNSSWRYASHLVRDPAAIAEIARRLDASSGVVS